MLVVFERRSAGRRRTDVGAGCVCLSGRSSVSDLNADHTAKDR